MCDMHCDLEVFRLRLGKALNYEYDEDTQAGLFFKTHPREGVRSPTQLLTLATIISSF